MISYQPALPGIPLPPINGLYQYLMTANGVFLRAERDGLKVQFQIASVSDSPIRGLMKLDEALEFERVPAAALDIILDESRQALPYEALFYLEQAAGKWKIVMPEQRRSHGSVHPVNPDDPACAAALVEIHSHNTLPAFFSTIDDQEEAFGFRVYAVVGEVNSPRPQIVARIGIHGLFFPVPAHWVFGIGPLWEDVGPYCGGINE